jgi:UDP-N-acetylmuramoylalanine--D-glutamate ligase
MKRIAILGAGESGLGAAMLAKKNGYAVWVSDAGIISESRKTVLTQNEISFEEGGHNEEKILNAEFIIKSPGISPKSPIVTKAIQLGIPVIDELEFAAQFSNGKIIAITGTNGKTTTTLLTYHLLKNAGLNVGLAGNVGQSWAGQLVDHDHDWWVIECSSFQIDGFVEFKPAIAILTNITPDHLDRYEYQIEKYIDSKFNLFKNMGADTFAILCAEDKLTLQGIQNQELGAKKVWFSTLSRHAENGAFSDGETLHFSTEKGFASTQIDLISIKGTHNILNSLCAGTAALLAGVQPKELNEGFQTFRNAPHRMELIREIDGIQFINDSKGTNVEATAYALTSFSNPLIWIAGGVDKGNDYQSILTIVAKQVKCLICLGKDNEKLKKAFGSLVPEIRETQDIEEAVNWGLELGQSGDIVLLSPACASFDLFKNYEDRGEQFRTKVNQLKTKMKP